MTIELQERPSVKGKKKTNSTAQRDQQCISRVLCGETEAFEELVRRYRGKVRNLALKITKNESDAEEVVQDTFLNTLTKLHTFQGKSSFSSWLYRITTNNAYMCIRSRKRDRCEPWEESLHHSMFPIPGMFSAPTSWSSSGDHVLYRKEISTLFHQAMKRLPRFYQDLLKLREIDRVTNQEIAEIVGLSVSAVKSRLHRARVLLRKALTEYGLEYNNEIPTERHPK